MKFYDIQDEIIVKAKYYGFLSTGLLMYFLVIFQVISSIRENAYPPIQNYALLVLGLQALYWILPNPGSPKKNNIQRLFILIGKNRRTYHPLEVYDYNQEIYESDFFRVDDQWEEQMLSGEEGVPIEDQTKT